MFWHVQRGEDPRSDQGLDGDIISRLAWEHLGIPVEELEAREREVWTSLFRLMLL